MFRILSWPVEKRVDSSIETFKTKNRDQKVLKGNRLRPQKELMPSLYPLRLNQDRVSTIHQVWMVSDFGLDVLRLGINLISILISIIETTKVYKLRIYFATRSKLTKELKCFRKRINNILGGDFHTIQTLFDSYFWVTQEIHNWHFLYFYCEYKYNFVISICQHLPAIPEY